MGWLSRNIRRVRNEVTADLHGDRPFGPSGNAVKSFNTAKTLALVLRKPCYCVVPTVR